MFFGHRIVRYLIDSWNYKSGVYVLDHNLEIAYALHEILDTKVAMTG